MKKFIILLVLLVLTPACMHAGTGNVGLKGFRASDWNNAGTVLYAITTGTIYRSIDRGANWTSWYTLPVDPDMMAKYGESWTLTIPTKAGNEKADKMLVSQFGTNSLYLCADINKDSPIFTKVLSSDHVCIWADNKHDWGSMAYVDEDSSGNLYFGAYNLEPGPGADLFKSTDRGATWTKIKSWSSRHTHDIRCNPYNGWLYVITSEHQPLTNPSYTDDLQIFRSKDGGTTWVSVFNSYKPEWLNGDGWLTLLAMDFIDNMVLVGAESGGYAESATGTGDIYRFIDDGTDGPFALTKAYEGAGGNGEIWWGAVKMNGVQYWASTAQNKTITAELVSSSDGINWTQVQIKLVSTIAPKDRNLGIITQHPDRGHRLIYSLSSDTGYYLDYQEDTLLNSGFYDTTALANLLNNPK
jgi:hypothetical protein